MESPFLPFESAKAEQIKHSRLYIRSGKLQNVFVYLYQNAEKIQKTLDEKDKRNTMIPEKRIRLSFTC